MHVVKDYNKMDDLFSCDLSESVGTGSLSLDTNGGTNQEFQQYLTKVESDGHAPLFILVSERPGLYYLEVSDGSRGWVGTYSYKNIQQVAKEGKMVEEHVALDTKRALTGDNTTGAVYIYTAIENSSKDTLELTWKKQLTSNNDVKITLGQVVLEACHDMELHARIMDHAVMEIQHLRANIVELTKAKKRLTEERVAVLKRFEQCVNIKEEIEGDLYGKFKLVLNEKKAKVRGLMESLKRDQKDMVTTATTGKRSHAPNETTPTIESTDDEVSDIDDKATPSPKSKQEINTGTDALMDDNWETGVASSPPVKRRKRIKNPPAPRVIPRPSLANKRSASRDSEDTSEKMVDSQDLINMM